MQTYDSDMRTVIYNMSDDQEKKLNEWYKENPYCTHAAWLATLKNIMCNKQEEKDYSFFNSLEGKVFSEKSGNTTKFYVVTGKSSERSGELSVDGWFVDKYAFETLYGKIASLRKDRMNVGPDKCELFKGMKESGVSELEEFIEKILTDLKSGLKS